MKRMIMIGITMLALAGLLFAGGTKDGDMAFNNAQSLDVVSVTGGLISGVSSDTTGVTLFKGIPFAAPPVGELRWKAPSDVIPWDGVKACDVWPNMPIQDKSGSVGGTFYGDEFYYSKENDPAISEDCLYLNLYTPATNATAKTANLPVFFYIHGGGNDHGYASKVEFNASELAKKGVIVVVVQYRLGPFGFLALPELTAEGGTSGNYAILDQVKALQWVQDNIKAFGGDPSNVTIGGQSAGAFNARVLLSTPAADGLYRRAILQSGFSYNISPLTLSSLEQAEVKNQEMVNQVFGEGTTLRDLRNLDADVFSTREVKPLIDVSKRSVVDDVVIHSSRLDIEGSGQLTGLDILIGGTSDEMTSLAGDPAGTMTLAAYAESLKKTFGNRANLLFIFPADNETEAYRTNLSFRSKQNLMQNRLNSIQTKSRTDYNSYVYYFNQDLPFHLPEYVGGRDEAFYGSFHSSELWYMFGSMRDIPAQRQWTEKDHELSDIMMTYWSNFMRTGNPNGNGLPHWEQSFEGNKGSYMLFKDHKATLSSVLDNNQAGENLYLSVLQGQGLADAHPVKPLDTIKEVAPVPVNAAGFTMNTEDPYKPPVWGLGHDLVANGARYSVFVPESQHPWKPGVIILTPNGTTAKSFALSKLGRQWMAAAEKYEFHLGFMEPADGDVWNISGDPNLRNDQKAVEDVYTQMRSKSQKLSLPFTMDKSRVSLVGYEEGAAMALVGAAGFPAAFCGVAAIDSTAVDYTYLESVGKEYCFPFPADGLKAKAEIGLVSNTVPMPAWFINSKDNGALEYFKSINDAAPSYSNEYAAVFANPDNSVERVWVANSSEFVTPSLLWNEFLSRNTRPLGVEGGHLGYSMDFSQRRDGTGYVYSEEMFDGFLRKWITYVPSSYDASVAAPLVTVLHGYTASMYALAEESRWSDIAEEHGVIVVFAQAYPNILPSFPNIPAPAWISPNLFVGDETSTDDILFMTHVIESTRNMYTIDESRVYGTGHSNGSSMTYALASSNPDLYTAIAPIGSASVGVSETLESLVPTWIFVGQFDGAGYEIEEGNRVDKAIDYWTRVNKLDRDDYTTVSSENGRFTTLSWNSGAGNPVVRYSKVNRSAHAYFPEQSWKMWNEFFSLYTRGADGKVTFTK